MLNAYSLTQEIIKKMENKKNLKDRTLAFAIRIIKLYQYLIKEKNEYVMSKQILKSGTSIGANYREGQNAESKLDFIHKLSISQKEAAETLYWLELLIATGYITKIEFDSLSFECTDIYNMIKSSILTVKNSISVKK